MEDGLNIVGQLAVDRSRADRGDMGDMGVLADMGDIGVGFYEFYMIVWEVGWIGCWVVSSDEFVGWMTCVFNGIGCAVVWIACDTLWSVSGSFDIYLWITLISALLLNS